MHVHAQQKTKHQRAFTKNALAQLLFPTHFLVSIYRLGGEGKVVLAFLRIDDLADILNGFVF